MTALNRSLADEWDKARTQKRDGGKGLVSLDAETGPSVDAMAPVCRLLDGTVRCDPATKPSAIAGHQDGKRVLVSCSPIYV